MINQEVQLLIQPPSKPHPRRWFVSPLDQEVVLAADYDALADELRGYKQLDQVSDMRILELKAEVLGLQAQIARALHRVRELLQVFDQ